MSKKTFIKTIRMELEKLNQDIDLKIIRGLSYKQESLRHKFLMKELSKAMGNQGVFNRAIHFMSAFML